MRPAALIEARNEFEAGKRSADDLRRAEDDAVRAVVAKQEALGFKAVTDGEFRRTSWNRDFLLRFENIVLGPGRVKLGTEQKTPTSTAVTGKISRPQPIFVEHFAFLRSVATATPKLTMPSPTIVHFRGGRESIDRTAYPDLDAFFADLAAAYRAEIADLAAAGCRYLQIDDVNFAYLCDADVTAQLRAAGDDPQTLPHTYAQLINAAIADRPDDMLVGMHVCRGNGPTGWATGGYEPVAETIFNEINVDTYFLESRWSACRRLRTAALLAERQERRARARLDENGGTGIKGRSQAPNRRGGDVRTAGTTGDQPAVRIRQRFGQVWQSPYDRRRTVRQVAARRRSRDRGMGVTRFRCDRCNRRSGNCDRCRPAGAQRAPIRIGAGTGDAHMEPFYAQTLGSFKRAGLDVALTTFANPAAIAEAMAGGAIDVGLSDPLQLAQAMLRGIPFAYFAGGTLFSVATPTLVLCSGSQGAIRNAKDLERKTIAVPTVHTFVDISISEWLKQNGADPSGVKFFEMHYGEVRPGSPAERSMPGSSANRFSPMRRPVYAHSAFRSRRSRSRFTWSRGSLVATGSQRTPIKRIGWRACFTTPPAGRTRIGAIRPQSSPPISNGPGTDQHDGAEHVRQQARSRPNPARARRIDPLPVAPPPSRRNRDRDAGYV